MTAAAIFLNTFPMANNRGWASSGLGQSCSLSCLQKPHELPSRLMATSWGRQQRWWKAISHTPNFKTVMQQNINWFFKCLEIQFTLFMWLAYVTKRNHANGGWCSACTRPYVRGCPKVNKLFWLVHACHPSVYPCLMVMHTCLLLVSLAITSPLHEPRMLFVPPHHPPKNLTYDYCKHGSITILVCTFSPLWKFAVSFVIYL